MEITEIYRKIAAHNKARKRCIKLENKEWEEKHTETIEELLRELPHGSGLDGGWSFDGWKSNSNLLIFHTVFHSINENGYYDRYIEFTLKVKADLELGLKISITGNFGKRQDIKKYLYEILQ